MPEGNAGPEPLPELWRALGACAESPTSEMAGAAESLELGPPPASADYTQVFELQVFPYASVYLTPEGMMGGEARDRVAGFWRALEIEPPDEPDHLVSVLGLHAALSEAESGATEAATAWQHRRRAHFWEHMAPWLPLMLDAVDRVAPPFYRTWSDLLARVLDREAGALGHPDELPLQLQAAPRLPDPEVDGGEALLGALLSPLRSGVVLTNSDLQHAAVRLGLGSRIGERRFLLKSLFSQDSSALLTWLAGHCEAASKRHRERKPIYGSVAAFWQEQAEASSRLLRTLATVAADSAVP